MFWVTMGQIPGYNICNQTLSLKPEDARAMLTLPLSDSRVTCRRISPMHSRGDPCVLTVLPWPRKTLRNWNGQPIERPP